MTDSLKDCKNPEIMATSKFGMKKSVFLNNS